MRPRTQWVNQHFSHTIDVGLKLFHCRPGRRYIFNQTVEDVIAKVNQGSSDDLMVHMSITRVQLNSDFFHLTRALD